MKIKNYYLGILVAAVALGLMLSLQFRAQDTVQDPAIERTNKLNIELEEKKEELAKLQTRIEDMRISLEKAASQPEMKDLQKELKAAGILAGITPVKGPGLEVTLSDSNVVLKPDQNPNLYVLHDEDVLKVLNELKAAGAEALAINDQRMVATSEIRCIGPTILTNGNKRLAVPFVVKAVGDPDTLHNSLFMKGGVAENLKHWGIQISAKKVKEINIPSYNAAVTFEP